MEFKNVAVLTSRRSWFVPYAKELVDKMKLKRSSTKLFFSHENISDKFEIVLILSYFTKIPDKYLKKHKHNLVIHESDLPEGKGWAILFWQILEGKNEIPVVVFDATEKIDNGSIYVKDYICLEGHELHDEIRKIQGEKTIELCLEFLENYGSLKSYKQKGKSTFYRRRIPEDSKLDINKSIKSQFNLLRIVNNEEFPAFFEHQGHKYILKIFKDKSEQV